ncbi:class I SAM-dependent methyltransferase [Montanilutibacter psychrotolerans]|uniref:Class I SAM-dependent methyltransferase n=1 Tax=Montanilutibacter psychrotolerans TaxID=1327343 RepID=A0A3M8SSG4_9GAMM|nr:class I SAM-dependent methyltransferase [Lysobacter psychrotolerans]RNF84267.1 class I SAM-dependent methyltransferase [Lysobacter psychrotolerans]
MGTDRDWENWGRNDPYFGVISDESFRAERMTDQARAAFFRMGDEHVERLLATIGERFQPGFRPEASLDFGCGVGRLLIPLARQSDRATGVDISPAMLAEARRNCELMGIDNVELIGSDDGLSQARGEYDLVHSHIVFAHIDPRRGHRLIEAMASKVRPHGYIAVQVLYACTAPRWIRALVKLRYRFPLLNAVRNILRGRPAGEPPMQLHVYDLPTILRTLNRLGFGEALLITDKFSNGEFDSVVLVARRGAASGD